MCCLYLSFTRGQALKVSLSFIRGQVAMCCASKSITCETSFCFLTVGGGGESVQLYSTGSTGCFLLPGCLGRNAYRCRGREGGCHCICSEVRHACTMRSGACRWVHVIAVTWRAPRDPSSSARWKLAVLCHVITR